MIRTPHGICFLISLLILSVPSRLPAQESEVQWRSDYQSARKEALDKNLPLMLDFGTQNCFHCRRQDETTLKDPQIISMLNQKFIPVKIDGDQETRLTQALRIGLYPTIVLASSEGKILASLEGYQETAALQEKLQRVVASMHVPEWMTRDLAIAQKAFDANDFVRSIPLLRAIVEDGKNRTTQVTANKLLLEIEGKAQKRLSLARDLREKGSTAEMIAQLTEIMQMYPGMQATREAGEMMNSLAQTADMRTPLRQRQAKELMTQAKEFYKTRDYIPCLDRCSKLISKFSDLAEGQEAAELAVEIRSNPAWLQGAADAMSEQLGSIYLSLAESLLKQGQPDRAEFYLQRVIQSFPGSRQAESAQIRINQLTPVQPARNEIQSARP